MEYQNKFRPLYILKILERYTDENHQLTSNEKIYYIVDALNDAINRKKKVSFLYFDYLPDKKKRIKNGGKPYVIIVRLLMRSR